MKKLRIFLCVSGVKIERLVEDDVTKIKCKCKSEAVRVVSAAKYFSNTTGKSPSV